MSGSRIVLLSGIPSVGKSSFAAWARRVRGVAHIDAEHDWAKDVAHLRLMWGTDPSQIARFVEALRKDGRPFIFDWGFPISQLAAVRAFHDAGAALWWLDGDLNAAPAAHKGAGKDLASFDLQVSAIRAASTEILPLFPAERTVRMLDATGTFMHAHSIYERLFGSS